MFEPVFRVQDIEKEIALPCLHKEVVILDMDPFGKKTYNVIQAAIAVNAVDSERTDQVSLRALLSTDNY
jgi:hypothetical protein